MNDTAARNSDPNNPKEEVVDLRKLFFRLLAHWQFFALALFFAFGGAWVYNNYTLVKYRVTSTLLIEEDNKPGAIGTDKLLQGFGLNPGMQNLDNQIQILTSWSLIGRAIDSLPFEIEYYTRGRINKGSLYPMHPITVIEEKENTIPREVEFEIQYLGDNKFTIDAESDKGLFEMHRDALFGEKIEIAGGSFRIDCESIDWFTANRGIIIYFVFHSGQTLSGGCTPHCAQRVLFRDRIKYCKTGM